MTATLWIAFGFLAALIVLLAITIFIPPKDPTGRATVKFFTALSAGFSGGFFTGNALFTFEQKSGGTTLAVSGVAGCALFFVVWFVYPKIFKLDDANSIHVPAGWTFRDTVETIANAPCEFVGFRPDELDQVTRAGNVKTKSMIAALLQVRLITATVNAVRRYKVEKSGEVYRLHVE